MVSNIKKFAFSVKTILKKFLFVIKTSARNLKSKKVAMWQYFSGWYFLCRKEITIRYIHMYIIGHYNHLVKITTQLHIPPMLCVLILYMSGRTYNLKSIPNDRYLRNVSWQIYLLSKFFARNLLKESRRGKKFFLCLISQYTIY